MNKITLKAIKNGCSVVDFGYKYIYVDDIKTSYICNESADIVNTKNKKFNSLKHIILPNGYEVVTLSLNGNTYREYVHRIVAKLFINIPEKYKNKNLGYEDLEVNHKDGVKTNNNSYNLEWSTDKDNKIHAYNMGLSKSMEDSAISKYSNFQIHLVCKYLEENELPPREISKRTGVSIGQIHDIKNFGSWKNISKYYDFSKYTPKQQIYTTEQIREVKKHILTKDMTLKEIAELTGMKIKSVYYYRKQLEDQKGSTTIESIT